ncbi:MAG: hypothetical protein HW380_3478 [Magnetococcales bacterium]|nr:hypothetical protein [Magnetococcales bacterium]HIJ83312.1 antitermination protein NusG [Magnetococcales bacterium]
MFYKIILPLFLMGVVYFIGRTHANCKRLAELPASHPHQRLVMGQGPVGKIAVILVISTILSASWMVYSYWRGTMQVVEVGVLNVETGKKTVYEAYKGDVHGRIFDTLDGRRVTLADMERMEVIPK